MANKQKKKTRARRSTSAKAVAKKPSARARFAAVTSERKRLDRTVDDERSARMARYATELQAISKPSVGLEAATNKPTLRVLAEGDSWFDYPPGSDLIDELKPLLGVPIANMAHHGDEVRGMLSLKQRREIEKRLAAKAPDQKPWDVMLFSGGGNDFAGDELCLWIAPSAGETDVRKIINQPRFSAVMQIVEAGYRDLIAIRDAVSPTTTLFFHTYDFAPPNGEGVCGVGPWLKPSLDFRNVATALQPAVVNEMLAEFKRTLQRAIVGAQRVEVVDTQGAIPASTKEWWANELHPKPKGFALVAARVGAAIRQRFP